MKRVCGFALFFFSVGLSFSWLLQKRPGQFLLLLFCLGLSYYLFFH